MNATSLGYVFAGKVVPSNGRSFPPTWAKFEIESERAPLRHKGHGGYNVNVTTYEDEEEEN